MSISPDALNEFGRLVEIVQRLRGPNGCPWDKEQTQKSLTRYVIEEAFELAEALDSEDQTHIQEELGDYLFQVILQGQVAEDEGHFKLADILRTLNAKMIRRHPHVFDPQSEKLHSATEVLGRWQKIKAQEKSAETGPPRLAKDLRGFPSLLTSLKIGHRSEDWKFDWDTPEQVEAKVVEELAEVREASAGDNHAAVEEEVGDLLFAVSQWARHLKVDPEAALRKANLKFEQRFFSMLSLSGMSQDEFRALPLSEKEVLWGKAKKLHKKT